MHPDQATAAIPLMLQNAWEARLDSRARLQARGRFDADHARMLTLALQDDLRRAWASGDGETLALLLPFAGRLDEGPHCSEAFGRACARFRPAVMAHRQVGEPCRPPAVAHSAEALFQLRHQLPHLHCRRERPQASRLL